MQRSLSAGLVADGSAVYDAAEVSRMAPVECEVGKVARVAQAMTRLDGVQLAEDIAGPYDVIARVEASGLDELGRLIVSRIQGLDGVTRTLTCMFLHR
jgi:DNA-binding Lrp family transcriptional regulator